MFLPKLLISFFYGVGTLLAASLAKELFFFATLPTEELVLFDFNSFFGLSLILLSFTLFSFFLDLFFNGLYPIMVSLLIKNNFSFKKSFELVKPKLLPIFLGGLILTFLLFLVSVIESVILFFINFSELTFVISFLFAFGFGFLFYFIYPKLVFEKEPIFKKFFSSVSSSIKNKELVFLLSLVPFSVSVLKFLLAFFAEDFLFLLVFWGLVLLTGVIYSIHAVMNQISYERLLKQNKELGDGKRVPLTKSSSNNVKKAIVPRRKKFSKKGTINKKL